MYNKAHLIIGLLIIGLMSACAKKTDNYETSPYVGTNNTNVTVKTPNIKNLDPTNPTGGINVDEVPKLSLEEREKRLRSNIVQPIVLGTSVSNLTMDMTVIDTLAVLTPPTRNYEDELIYEEGIWIKWKDEPNARKRMIDYIRIWDGYQGALSVPGFRDVKMGEDLSDILVDREAVEAFACAIYQGHFAVEEVDCNADNNYSVTFDEKGDAKFSFGLQSPTLIFLDENNTKLSMIVMWGPLNKVAEAKLFNNSRKPVIFGKSGAGVSFETTYAESKEILSTPEIGDDGQSMYDEGVWLYWSDDTDAATPGMIRLMDSYKGTIKVTGFADVPFSSELGDIFTSEQVAKDWVNALYKDTFEMDSAAEFDCFATAKCSMESLDSGHVRVTIGPAGAEIGYMFFNAGMSSLVQVIFFDVRQTLVAEANSQKPIIFGYGAAGINLDTTYEESLALLSSSTGKNDYGESQYMEGITVRWDESGNAIYMRVMAGYQGAMEVPGLPPIYLGADLSGYLVDDATKMAALNALFASYYEVEEGFDCVAPGYCKVQTGDDGSVTVQITDIAYLFFSPGMKTLDGMVFMVPQEEE